MKAYGEILSAFDDAARARFWALVEPENGDVCREWLGSKSDGYGNFRLVGRNWRAHRVSWVLYNGKEMGELFGCHSCDNKACCNPHHIWPGTGGDNKRDEAAKGLHKMRRGQVWMPPYQRERLKLIENVPLADRSRIALAALEKERAATDDYAMKRRLSWLKRMNPEARARTIARFRWDLEV